MRRLLAEDCGSQYVVRSSQMLDLLREGSNALEFTSAGRKAILLFGHGIRRWNHLLFRLGDPHIEFLADASTFCLPIGLCQRDAAMPQPKYEDEYQVHLLHERPLGRVRLVLCPTMNALQLKVDFKAIAFF